MFTEFFVGVPRIVQNRLEESSSSAGSFSVDLEANSLILSVKSDNSLLEKFKLVNGLGSILLDLIQGYLYFISLGYAASRGFKLAFIVYH